MSEIKNNNGVITLTSGFINLESTGTSGINIETLHTISLSSNILSLGVTTIDFNHISALTNITSDALDQGITNKYFTTANFDNAYGATFQSTFDNAYGATFQTTFDNAYGATFQTTFDNAYGATFQTTFDNAYGATFQTTFDNAYGATFQTTFDNAYGATFQSTFDNAYGATFQTTFDNAYGATFQTTFDNAYGATFQSTFDNAYGATFQSTFDNAYGATFQTTFDTALGATFQYNFNNAFDNLNTFNLDNTKGVTFTHTGDTVGKNFTIQETGLGDLVLQSTGLTAKVNIVSNNNSPYAVTIEALSGGIHFNPGTTEGTLFDNKIKIGGDLIYNSTTTTSASGGDEPDIISTNKALTLLTLDSGVNNHIYMSNGFNGQVKTIVVNSVQGGATAIMTKGITGAPLTNIINQSINTITFSKVGSSATFIYIAGAGWALINSYDVGINLP